jgi:hypothetical protein
MSELIIFLAQFICVFLLGIQSLMVRDSNCIGAASGSLMIGISQFYIFSIIGGLSGADIGAGDWWAFILAGPVAIVISIKTHPYISKHIFKRGSK